MSQETSSMDSLNEFETAKLPSTLNVLSILTFIGCGISFLYIICLPMLNKWFLGFMDKALNSGQELSSKQLADIENGKAAIKLVQANMTPLIIIGLVSVVLCFVGALWMRKLKKDGFWMYSVGEVLPLIGNFILIGTAQFNGVMSIVLGLAVPFLFIFLYSRQMKYFKK